MKKKKEQREYDVTPEELLEKKKEFFDFIAERRREYERGGYTGVVSAVAEYSIEDALTLMNEARFTPDEAASVLRNSRIYLKNEDFTDYFLDELNKAQGKMNRRKDLYGEYTEDFNKVLKM